MNEEPVTVGWAERMAADLLPFVVELHLVGNPETVTKYGKKIKAAGGKYNAVRGYSKTRYVSLPSRERALINALFKQYSEVSKAAKGAEVARGIMLVRMAGTNLPAWATVLYVPFTATDPFETMKRMFAQAVLSARARGVPGVDAPVTQEEHRTALCAKNEAAAKDAEVAKLAADMTVSSLVELLATEGGKERLAVVLAKYGSRTVMEYVREAHPNEEEK
jgi:hypothetical protein